MASQQHGEQFGAGIKLASPKSPKIWRIIFHNITFNRVNHALLLYTNQGITRSRGLMKTLYQLLSGTDLPSYGHNFRYVTGKICPTAILSNARHPTPTNSACWQCALAVIQGRWPEFTSYPASGWYHMPKWNLAEAWTSSTLEHHKAGTTSCQWPQQATSITQTPATLYRTSHASIAYRKQIPPQRTVCTIGSVWQESTPSKETTGPAKLYENEESEMRHGARGLSLSPWTLAGLRGL